MSKKVFKGLELDDFQEQSVEYIEKGKSVVVSAATGTGKTLIADFVIDKYLKAGKDIIYTAPIKALSNQKFNDFKEDYGQENVGILTGDVTINHDAPLRVMTTEIYRNMLLTKDPAVENVAYVIFDEIHFLGDSERGTVWEESIIFSHENTRFLCLSATIPNSRQFANWIEHIKNHKVEVVVEKKRVVPLKHEFFEIHNGFGSIDEIKTWKRHAKKSSRNKNRKQYFKELKKRRKNVHLDLIRKLHSENKLPCIYFCFSRKKTQEKAYLLSKRQNLADTKETKKITEIVRKHMSSADDSVKGLKTTYVLRECLKKGVGFHHAGLLPVLKNVVEELFNKGLLKALFATETFAVGINMPAKTVCFDSLEKFDGTNFRYLHSQEYFQLAGRAGRRGIDDKGFVISIIQQKFDDLNKIQRLTSKGSEKLKSQFKLSYNTILNLIRNYDEKEQKEILKQSFYSYQQYGRKGDKRIERSYKNKKKKLYKKNYVVEGAGREELTEKGLFASKIYTQELLVTDILCSKIEFTVKELLLILGTLIYEPRKKDKFKTTSKEHGYSAFYKIKQLHDKKIVQYFKDKPLFLLETFLLQWYEGCDFSELLEYTSFSEGDIVRLIRQILDLGQQIKHATLNEKLISKIKDIEHHIDRDVIEVKF